MFNAVAEPHPAHANSQIQHVPAISIRLASYG